MKKYIFFIFLYSSFFGLNAQTADFTYTQTSACAPTTFTFTNTSTGNILSYLWNFGDGFTNNTELNPIHPYTNSGTYTVTFTVYFQNGIVDSAKQTFQIFNPPVFSFTKLNDSVCPGSSVSFTSSVTSTIPIQSYYWDFGDGGHSTAAHPTYQYMNPSNITTLYSVSLTVTDANGCSHKESINNYIHVKQKPIPEFAADQQYFCYSPANPAIVNFINNTTVTTNNTYLWTFSDGQTSTSENPTMSFPNKGNISVNLTATSSDGCVNTISKSTYIQIVEFKVQYTVSDTIICSVPNTVVFRGTNPANVEYSWDFGDSTTAKSNISAVNKRYTSSGTYTVKIKGNFGSGACYDSTYTVIHVYDSATPAMLKYDSINLICEPFNYAIGFKDNTGYTSNDDFGFGSIVWNFGDSTTALGDTVSHSFPDYGEYGVTLSVTTPYGCKLKDTTEIIIVLPWEAHGGIHSLSQPPCIPYSANLKDFGIYSSTYVNVTVDWGNGTTNHQDSLIGLYPKKTPDRRLNGGSPFFHRSPLYYDTIDYVITFTAINEQGCVIFDTMGIFHGGIPPKAGATYNPILGCFSEFRTQSKLKVKAFDSLDSQGHPIAGVYANMWEWISIDNPMVIARTNEDSIALSVDRLGHFSVRMIPLHNGCPGNMITLDSIAYVCPPIAGFVHYDTSFCNFPVDVQFQNNSLGATAYKWYFGDADLLTNQSTDTATSPLFTYSLSNSFVYDNAPSPGLRPLLVAYNDDSLDVNSPTYNQCGFCTDTALGNIRISHPQLDFGHDTACEKNFVTFYDRNTSSPEIVGWRFELVSHNPLIQENIGKLPTQGNQIDSLIYLDPFAELPLYFNFPNTYTGYFFNRDVLGCEHSDTLVFNIYPKSTPALLSGKDTSFLTLRKDTLCRNALDWLYLKDNSYTTPFDSAEIIAWQWIIDNETSYAEKPVFKNIPIGTHNVYMRITNEYGCSSDTTFVNHVLNNEITALFYPMMQQYCNHVPVEFYNSSYITPYSSSARSSIICTWDFGDGTPLYTDTGISNVQHTYHLTHTLPDTMFVTLTITYGEENCSATFTNSVIITGPIASFTDDGHKFPCPNLGRQIQFTNTSTGNPVAYYWQFGDISSGNSNESYLKNPVHDYRHVGSYDITLVVTDNVGCSDTLYIPKHVIIDGPIGDFTYGELEGCVEHTVTFIPNIITADSIIVNPDRASPIANTKSDIDNPITFTYRTPGAYLPYFYLIKWTYDNERLERCVVEWEASDTIYVIDITPNFEVDSVYCSNDPITLINTSKIIPPNFAWDSVTWDFGNGNTSHDIDSTTIQYQKDGIYIITLNLYTKGCHKEASKPSEILSFPEIYLNLESQSACDSLEFNFIAEVSPGNHEQLHFIWTFLDGTKSYTNPTKIQFDSTGYYHYQLEVALESNKCNKTFQDSVYIKIYVSPTADFEASPQPANFGEKISFTDLSTSTDGTINKWTWDLGDKTTSNEQHLSHIYNTSGKLSVHLYIEDEYGCKSDTSLEIIILESLEFPNVLTPIGSNGMKYVFRPMEEMGYYKEFTMHIYNRWGTLIWSNTCKEPDCPDYSDSFWWDGRTKNGNLVDDGVYYWVVSAIPLSETTIFIKNGSVTVFHSK